jgi:hypothetical protein
LHELPDAAGFVTRQQNTHGESNPAHFSVKTAARAAFLTGCASLVRPISPSIAVSGGSLSSFGTADGKN